MSFLEAKKPGLLPYLLLATLFLTPKLINAGEIISDLEKKQAAKEYKAAGCDSKASRKTLKCHALEKRMGAHQNYAKKTEKASLKKQMKQETQAKIKILDDERKTSKKTLKDYNKEFQKNECESALNTTEKTEKAKATKEKCQELSNLINNEKLLVDGLVLDKIVAEKELEKLEANSKKDSPVDGDADVKNAKSMVKKNKATTTTGKKATENSGKVQ